MEGERYYWNTQMPYISHLSLFPPLFTASLTKNSEDLLTYISHGIKKGKNFLKPQILFKSVMM